MALEVETKLVVSCLLQPSRETMYATELMADLKERVVGRLQISTNGLGSYSVAVERVFGGDVDFGQIVKHARRGQPATRDISTSLAKRHNLTTHMSLRRNTRRTNGFSKSVSNHEHALALYIFWYNFMRPHMSLGPVTTPAMAAGLTERPLSRKWLLQRSPKDSEN